MLRKYLFNSSRESEKWNIYDMYEADESKHETQISVKLEEVMENGREWSSVQLMENTEKFILYLWIISFLLSSKTTTTQKKLQQHEEQP